MSGTRLHKHILVLVVVSVIAAACQSAAETSVSETDASGTPRDQYTLGAFPDPEAAELPAAVGVELQAALDEWVASLDDSAAVAAAVIGSRGQWSGSAGAVDAMAGSAPPPDAKFAIGSITKTFVAAEVLTLAEAGLVSLDEPIDTYLPPALDVDTNDATILDVLAMRSGIPEHTSDRFIQNVLDQTSRSWDPEDVLSYIETVPVFQPGSRFAYSNTNYILLGMVVEKVIDTSLARAIRDDLLAPARLDEVFFQDAEAPTPPLALSEHHDDSGYIPTRALARAAGAAGGMAASARDLAQWGYLLYGGQVLAPESLELMTTFRDGYGLGTAPIQTGGAEGVGHGGGIPGYASLLLALPEHAAVVAVLAVPGNAADADLLDLAGSLVDAALDLETVPSGT